MMLWQIWHSVFSLPELNFSTGKSHHDMASGLLSFFGFTQNDLPFPVFWLFLQIFPMSGITQNQDKELKFIS